MCPSFRLPCICGRFQSSRVFTNKQTDFNWNSAIVYAGNATFELVQDRIRTHG
jgi:hypothetical protein